MAKILLAGFKDPIRRPRFIVWTGVILLMGFSFMIVTLGATSTRWFCANGCHKVQDDLIAAYEAGSHAQISCLACHEPVNASAVTFMLLKGKAMIELYHTVSNTFHFPLNPGSALSQNEEEMPEGQCTQCHSANRVITPSPGIIIDHKAHAAKEIWCTVCHNRVAHPEQNIDFALVAPDGRANSEVKHTSFTKMTACFRCHDLEGKKDAPGTCSTCHAPGYPMEPSNHADPLWDTKLHHVAFSEEETAMVEAEKVAEEMVVEGIPKRLAEPVLSCYTCHIKAQFCDKCHGTSMPHPSDWLKAHAAAGKATPIVCAKCHAKGAAVTPTVAASTMKFCNDCHHKQGNPNIPWVKQHFKIVLKQGATACLAPTGGCHQETFCSHCHVRGPGPQ